jgi:DNA-binding GntR family transcriptional regulator
MSPKDAASTPRSAKLKIDIVGVLKEAILSNQIKAGERLNESELARQFEIPRASIREALQQLEEQGLVLSNPRKGMFVVNLDQADKQKMNSVRLVLEAEALRLCRLNLSPEGEKQLAQSIEKMERQIEGPADQQWRLDLAFHQILWKLCGNQYLEKALNRLTTPLFSHAVLTTPETKKLHTVIVSHRALLEYIQGKSNRPAEDLLIEHYATGFVDPGRFSSFDHPGKT